MSVRKRGNKWTVKIYDASAKGGQRWIGTYPTRREAQDAEHARDQVRLAFSTPWERGIADAKSRRETA